VVPLRLKPRPFLSRYILSRHLKFCSNLETNLNSFQDRAHMFIIFLPFCHDPEFLSCFVSYFEVLVSSVSLWLSALALIVSFCVIASPAHIVSTCVSFLSVQSPPPPCVCKPCLSRSRCGVVPFGSCLLAYLGVCYLYVTINQVV